MSAAAAGAIPSAMRAVVVNKIFFTFFPFGMSHATTEAVNFRLLGI